MHGRARHSLAAPLALLAMAAAFAGPMLVAAQTAQDRSNVVLVFDVSNSILLSRDGTNTEFAAALEGIADRVEESADELILGNAEISFVVFGRQAITYPNGCDRLGLHNDRAAISKLESCLRQIAADYRAGADAAVRNRVNTADTDHVAALREAASLLPNRTTRSAVIFFTDGQNDPPGTARDDEDVVTRVRAAFEGQSPLAILPVGLGAGAGAFETELRAIYDAYLRDMEPCEGRPSFAWPQVVFPAADDAGIAVAQALQEVTCSFTFVPTPSETPVPSPSPTPIPIAGAPQNVQALSGNGSITVQWIPPELGADTVTGYSVECLPEGGGGVPASIDVGATETEAVLDGLAAGDTYRCSVVANNASGSSEATAAAAAIVVLGIPLAPGQPRIDMGDASARVSVDAVAGGAPAEQYDFECRDTSGNVVGSQSAQQPSAVVVGLANGQTFDCVAYAENRIGKSQPSVASARFSPCGAFLDCNPWAKWAGLGLIVLATVAALYYVARRYQRRNRVWITAQVDGGENRPLGWGPEIGIQLQREEGGWFASLRPLEGADLHARYRGAERFVVTSNANVHDVHQGDPAWVRDAEGGRHDLILRRYRNKPKERKGGPAPAEAKQGSELGERLEGKDRPEPPPTQFVG